jgi:hypothetical protein
VDGSASDIRAFNVAKDVRYEELLVEWALLPSGSSEGVASAD